MKCMDGLMEIVETLIRMLDEDEAFPIPTSFRWPAEVVAGNKVSWRLSVRNHCDCANVKANYLRKNRANPLNLALLNAMSTNPERHHLGMTFQCLAKRMALPFLILLHMKG